MRLTGFLIGALLLSTTFVAPSHAQDLDFKKQIEQGRYTKLAAKLKGQLELAKCDPTLRTYLENNIAYLERGAKPRVPGSEIILVRGAKNDRLYQMPNADGRKRKDSDARLFNEAGTYPSGGPRLMLPNRIRYLHMAWDKRLTYFDRYFREATDLLGGDGDALRELDKIIEHHKGGGLGTSANSVKSVLISTSTRPLHAFGPPYYLIKIAPERCIFNYKGLSGEYEVLVPFWILPHEIVARCDSYQAVLDHPLYQSSGLKDVPFREGGFGSESNWVKLEANVRAGRTPLPLDPAPVVDAGIVGTVETQGKSVYLRVGGERLKVSPTSKANWLKRFEGMEARVEGKQSGENLAVEEILSPTYETIEARVEGDELVLDSGERLSTHGATARALGSASGEVKAKAYVFTRGDDTPYAAYVRYLQAELGEDVTLSRPLSTKVAEGTPVTIRYVSSSGRSAIVRTADGAWGWVRLTKLSIGKTKVGLSGSLTIGN